MHFNVVQPGGVLLGIKFFYFNEDAQLILARSAKRASYVDDSWLLEDIKETVISELETRDLQRKTLIWQTTLTPQALSLLASEPEELPISELSRYIVYLENNKLDSEPYRLALWQKVLQPLETLSLLLIALSFVFGPLRSSTMGFKVFIGVVVGVCFQFAQKLLGPASLIYGFEPLIAVLLPVLLCTAIGLFLLRRAA
jgi:lipopolysaccharide export system permease protein